MTPKEKAMEIAMKFDEKGETDNAKQCALICADEMLKPSFINGKRYDRALMEILFLQEVKQEIKKL